MSEPKLRPSVKEFASATEAAVFYDTQWWEGQEPMDIVDFQLYEPRLCMPFDLFHAAVEKVFGRPVWTHEFANSTRLQEEFERRRAGAEPEQTNPLATLLEVLG